MNVWVLEDDNLDAMKHVLLHAQTVDLVNIELDGCTNVEPLTGLNNLDNLTLRDSYPHESFRFKSLRCMSMSKDPAPMIAHNFTWLRHLNMDLEEWCDEFDWLDKCEALTDLKLRGREHQRINRLPCSVVDLYMFGVNLTGLKQWPASARHVVLDHVKLCSKRPPLFPATLRSFVFSKYDYPCLHKLFSSLGEVETLTIHFCPFQVPFARMIRQSTKLRHLFWSGVTHVENGYILTYNGKTVEKNLSMHAKCKKAALFVFWMMKFILGRDIAVLLAKWVWETRGQSDWDFA